MHDLLSLSRSIDVIASDGGAGVGDFVGIAIADSGHHLAKDSQGRPVILLNAGLSEVRPASIRLQNLRVEHGVRCAISQGRSRGVEGLFSVVHCIGDDVFLHECFLQLGETLLEKLGVRPTQRDVADAFERLVALFLLIEEPAKRSVQGLWGELFLISKSSDPESMLFAWHSQAYERCDFSDGHDRLEVKSSSNRERRHYFSLEQTHPPESASCIVASLFVEQASAGRTLGQLWDRIRALITRSEDLRHKLDRTCFDTLGASWADARMLAFDEQLADESLAFYDVRDIPRLDGNLAAGVSEVRFRSDLSLARTVLETGRPINPIVKLLM